MKTHHCAVALLEAYGISAGRLQSINDKLIASYAELIVKHGVLDKGHKGRLSFISQLRDQNAELERYIVEQELSARTSGQTISRLEIWMNEAAPGAIVRVKTKSGDTVTLATNEDGDGLYRDGVEVLATKNSHCINIFALKLTANGLGHVNTHIEPYRVQDLKYESLY